MISNVISRFYDLNRDLEENEILFELGVEESDTDTIDEASRQMRQLEKRIKKFSIDLTLDGEDDPNNSIVSINAGAGGTEAQDWAEMLFRMYASDNGHVDVVRFLKEFKADVEAKNNYDGKTALYDYCCLCELNLKCFLECLRHSGDMLTSLDFLKSLELM